MNPASCPTGVSKRERILLGHGSGGRLTEELVRQVFLPALGNPTLAQLSDSAVLAQPNGRLAMTTDSFVVKPLIFPGGDIGSLAVHGTVNDLAAVGARPLALSASFVLEEGLPIDDLQIVVTSMADAARRVGVDIVAADTKVVERGKADGIFINTTGVGEVPHGLHLGSSEIRPGDLVVVSGPIGDHGIAVLSAREGLQFGTEIESDSAALDGLVRSLIENGVPLRCLRDPTRGGAATTLHEIARAGNVQIAIDEASIPVRPGVHAACEMLGLDPLYVACEGRMLVVVPPDGRQQTLACLHDNPLGSEARVMGSVRQRSDTQSPALLLQTRLGTQRALEPLAGEQLPRIC